MDQNFLSQLGSSTAQAAPMLVLLATGLVLMLLDAFKQRAALPWVTAVGLLLSSVWVWMIRIDGTNLIFSGMMETGGYAPLVHVFLCISGLLTLFFLQDYLQRQDKPIDDVYALLTFSVLGMIMMANANDLIMIFIGLETMSMALYIFASLYKRDLKSNEAGLKYFLLGSFASAFLLFGISLIYGISGHTDLTQIGMNFDRMMENELIFFTGVGLILIGFLFKVAAFPFHSWTPDVYEGTPTPLAGFMATGSKMAAFVAFGVIIQKMELVTRPEASKVVTLLAISALLTMIYGNIVAARQTNIKRMLAYSSIAHSGYVLLGLCAASIGFQAVIFYMFIYTLMNIGAFGMVGMVEREYEDTHLDNWKGLGKVAPYFAAAMAVFLFSLAGIPPLAGFMSKYQVFITAIDADLTFLATAGILTSVIGAYYYIRVIVLMFFNADDSTPGFNVNFATLPVVGIAILVALLVVFGVAPSLVLEPITAAFGGLQDATISVLP